MTYVIQGSMAQPQVVMNPFSLVTPGIFRELLQMIADDPRVLPREAPTARNDGARSTNAPAAGDGPSLLAPTPEVGGSWAAQTNEVQAKRR